MRVLRQFAFTLPVLAGTLFASAQQVKQDSPDHFYFTSLTDPACPVTGYIGPVPLTKEIRVFYYPMGERATISNPKSLIVHMVFDGGDGPESEKTLPFTKRDDNVWIATIALGDTFPKYAIYWIEDRETKQVDTNRSKYFEVPFCDLHGQLSERSVQHRADSYTGQLQAHGIERGADYAKAIDVLNEYIYPPSRGENLISRRWEYELKLHGDTPEARSDLMIAIRKFISDHSADGFGLLSALNFAVYRDWFPPDTMETLIQAVEKKYPTQNPRAFILSARASHEKSQQKRIALQWELLDNYPDSPEADFARKQLLMEVTDLAQQEKLYRQIHAGDPEDAFEPLNMARFYLKANQKLPEALALLDESDRILIASTKNDDTKIHYPESTLRDVNLRIATMRADILIRLNRPKEAVAALQPMKNSFTSGSSYYFLGKALQAAGDKSAAIDAYVEAVVRPSNDQQRANTALESLWSSEKRGTRRDLQQLIEAKLNQNFSGADYQPHLLGHPAPDFDLTTLNGERLSRTGLRGKRVILDFWSVWCSPCLWELKPLQDFQKKHPEIVVATVVETPPTGNNLKL